MGVAVSEIKYVQSLRIKKFRQKYHHFVVEGDKAVQELLHSDWKVLTCYYRGDFNPTGKAERFVTVNGKEMERLSHHQSPQQALAVVEMMEGQMPASFTGLQLYLDGIRDPGNLGTIIRIADWYGLNHIWCSEDTVDVYNPKCIDASMGSFLRVKVIVRNANQLLEESGVPSYAAIMNGENIHRSELPEDALLFIGNEGKGLSPDLIRGIQHPISIPRFGQAESLNAAIATAVLLDNFKRGN